MKRVHLSVGILIIIISLNFASLYYIRSSISELQDMLDEIQYSVRCEAYGKAQKQLSEFCAKWHEKENMLVRLVRHPGIDNATNVISELTSLLEYQNYSVFMSKADMVKAIVIRIWEDEVPVLQNIM